MVIVVRSFVVVATSRDKTPEVLADTPQAQQTKRNVHNMGGTILVIIIRQLLKYWFNYTRKVNFFLTTTQLTT
jgi:uncharacterized membrane protein